MTICVCGHPRRADIGPSHEHLTRASDTRCSHGCPCPRFRWRGLRWLRR